MPTLSKKAEELKPSPLQEFFKKTKLIKNVFSLAVGEMDFPNAQHIKTAAYEAIDQGHTKYTAAIGALELRKLAATDFQKDNIKAEVNNTIISSGAKPLIAATIWAVCGEGDEILIPGPFYPPYWDFVKACGGKPILVDTKEDGFMLTEANIKKHLSDRTKAIILNSPNNPTGAVWDWKEIQNIDSDIWFIADEAYHRVIYDAGYTSIASFDNIKDRVITIRSCSKTYNMTGWRIGYLTGPEKLTKAIQMYLEMSVGCPCAISQKAAVSAFEKTDESLINEKERLNQRRSILMDWLRQQDIPFVQPQGAFYIFADISKYKLNSIDFSNFLLEKMKIAVTPGVAFGPYDGYVRISYAAAKAESLKARLAEVAKVLKLL